MKTALKASCLLSLSALIFQGCSSGPGDVPPLGTVTGVVTLDGQPYSGIRVIFQPSEGGRSSDAMTGDDGSYRLVYSLTEYGAKVGKHHVHFENDVDLGGPVVKKVPAVPAAYGEKSTLEEEVKPGRNKIDFPLKSGK